MNYKIIIICTLIVSLWSSAFIGSHIVMESMDSSEFAFYRLSISSIFLYIVSKKNKQTAIAGKDMMLIALSGLLGSTFYCLFFNKAQVLVTSTESCLIINTMPLFAALMSWLIYGEKITQTASLGLSISMTGIVIISLSGNNSNWSMGIGYVYLIVASLSLALSTVIQKKLLRKYSAIQVLSLGLCFAAISLLPFNIDIDSSLMKLNHETHLWVFYLALFPSGLAYLLWGHLLQKVSTQRATSIFYFIPVVTGVIGYFHMDEHLSTLKLSGGVLAICGVMISQSQQWAIWKRASFLKNYHLAKLKSLS
ncbi:MAG: EamA family transporter [Planctomycetes bacterium]|nr:EamA family transporter [Planctomycetota bacterium]